jgi:hypothetical protein
MTHKLMKEPVTDWGSERVSREWVTDKEGG